MEKLTSGTKVHLRFSKICWPTEYGSQTAEICGQSSLTLCKLRIFNCQRVHTEVTERKSTTLCRMFGTEPDLKKHFKKFGIPSLENARVHLLMVLQRHLNAHNFGTKHATDENIF